MGIFQKIAEQSIPKPIEFPEAVKYGERSIIGYGCKIEALERSEKILWGKLDDKAYQIIAIEDYYYFVCVESDNFITDFDTPQKIMLDDKNNFIVPKNRMFSTMAWVEYGDDNCMTVKRAEIKFNWYSQNQNGKPDYSAFYISLTHEMPLDILTSFFNGVNDLKIRNYDEYEKPKFNKKEKKFCVALYRTSAVLGAISLVSSIIALISMFKAASIVASIIPLVFFVLYILFTKYFDIALITTSDEYETGIDMRFQLVHIMGLCTAPGFLYHMSNIRPYLDTSNYTLLFFSIVGVCLVLFLIRSSQARKSLKAFAVVALCIVISVSSSIWLVNIMCPSESTSYTATVTDKYTKATIKAIQRYRVIVNVKGEDMYFGVDRDYYKSIEIGDEVTIKEYEGALNIPYVDIDEEN